jgi:NAD(P)-dependent dehydrogenase (short-subunit alcohol dehydrogenase family)
LSVDLHGQTALITGGTMGIGLETALSLAGAGAECAITYKWGTADEDAVRARFRAAGGRDPLIFRADAASEEDTRELLEWLHEDHERIDIFVSNVSAALVVKDLEDYTRRDLYRSIDYSAWPLVHYTRQIHALFGSYPSYIIGLSSTGVDQYARGYDFMAAAKAVLETLCRYLNYHLQRESVRINIVRSRNIRTQALADTFGTDFERFARRFMRDEHFMEASEVGNVILALCSGWMDGYSGQILTVDRGMSFFDNLMRLYNEREELAL